MGGRGEVRVSSLRVRNAVRHDRTSDEDGAIVGPIGFPGALDTGRGFKGEGWAEGPAPAPGQRL